MQHVLRFWNLSVGLALCTELNKQQQHIMDWLLLPVYLLEGNPADMM